MRRISHQSIVVMLLIGLATSLASASVAAADGRQWARVDTYGEGPSARSRPAAAAIGRKIYVFGGAFDEFSSGNYRFYNDLYVLDTAIGLWERLSPRGETPAPRAFTGHAALASGIGFVVFGGGTFSKDQIEGSYGDLWLFLQSEQRWLRLSSEQGGPGKRFDAKVWSRGNKIYVFGGTKPNNQATNDLWTFDLRTAAWSLVGPDGAPGAPPARGVARGPDDALDGKLYFYGGEGGVETGYKIFDDVWVYDLGSHTWEDHTPSGACQLSPARNHNSVVRVGRNLYAYGGDIPGGLQTCGAPFPQNPIGELTEFNTQRECWEKLDARGDAPPPLKRHESVVVGSAIYLLSGFDFASSDGADACQAWNLDVWVYR